MEFKVGDEVFVGSVPARVRIAAISPCGNWVWLHDDSSGYAHPHYAPGYPYYTAAVAELRPAPRPHPHAVLMAEYAKDAAETDRPWERWEYQVPSESQKWGNLRWQPTWHPGTRYRRKGQQS